MLLCVVCWCLLCVVGSCRFLFVDLVSYVSFCVLLLDVFVVCVFRFVDVRCRVLLFVVGCCWLLFALYNYLFVVVRCCLLLFD